MYYKYVVIIIALAIIGLGCRFIFASDAILKEWGLESIDSTGVLARRLGAIYLGLSVLLFLSLTEMSKERTIIIGVSAISGFLAISGILDLLTGRVNTGVIRSVVAELFLCLVLISTFFIKR
ncbi:hypothetical protein [Pedobacter sp. GR22-10]|uniref:hypothetical protein n=1 Tax=Pedobacter sp. GR22-10 TaxID=2994472 RepID=UPI0022452D11|nr:hypothetical protein [Pedobacter sp. GR22-10]MCX2430396.1 hypothetical protein [Pedobacter sp. GR22-10]